MASDSNFNVKWFKDQIARRNTSQRKIAIKLGLNQAVISHMFAGRRKMGLEEATKWAEILDVRLDEVIANAGIDLPPQILVNTRRGGGPRLRDQTIEITGWIDNELTVHLGRPKGSLTAPNPTGQLNVAALRCQTTGGSFSGMDGAILYYTPPLDKFDPDILTRLCIVKIKSKDKLLLRTVNRGYVSGRYNLSLMSGEAKEEDVSVVCAVPVIWMKL